LLFSADAMTQAPEFKHLQQGRALSLLHQCLEAFDGDAATALRWCEAYTGTSPALRLMLREVCERKRRHQFLPQRRRSASHG
jgi:hypothetical protein